MMDVVYKAFKNEYETQKETGFNTSVIDGMSGFIFRNREGKMLTMPSVNRAIARIYQSYNQEEILAAKRLAGHRF